jgi:squalene-hopene/tetraprenyl-beta-curcumene cyclase
MDEQDQSRYGLTRWESLIENGSVWLSKGQNPDGGFGDTNRSLSNIATTLLVIAAWELAGHSNRFAEQVKKAWQYVDRLGRWDGLRKRYGKDKTFVVPIMTNCAIAGLLDWKEIPTVPFEAAALPQSWYRFAKMPVVSYAVPALVAIGQAQFVHVPPRNPVAKLVRASSRRVADILKQHP